MFLSVPEKKVAEETFPEVVLETRVVQFGYFDQHVAALQTAYCDLGEIVLFIGVEGHGEYFLNGGSHIEVELFDEGQSGFVVLQQKGKALVFDLVVQFHFLLLFEEISCVGRKSF